MSKQALVTVLTFSLVLAAVPAFAQQGKGGGVGVGIGSNTQVGAGGSSRVQTPVGNVGAKTNTDVKAKTSTEVKTRDGKRANESEKEHMHSTVATKLEANPTVAAKVQALLPKGESMNDAAAGFKNEGQFIAALHVSKNLNIPFDQLKAKMTGSESMSLGAAIKASRPDMSEDKAKDEAKKAEVQAKETEKTEKK
jgi:hypothetical protein